jgi:hypothetical protein
MPAQSSHGFSPLSPSRLFFFKDLARLYLTISGYPGTRMQSKITSRLIY